jgi:hypothetical protein
MAKRNLDGVYFRVMRDGLPINLCWTDLAWEDKVDVMLENNSESWLIRMIEIMNHVGAEINSVAPIANVKLVKFPTNKPVTMTWLRTSLMRITADVQMAADEYGITGEL